MLISTRSQYVTQIRALLQSRLITFPRCAAYDFAARLDECELPDEINRLVTPLSALLPSLQVQISEADERIHQHCESIEAVQRLATIPGIAIVTAAMFVSVIDIPDRFRRPGQVPSYLGLVPIERSTGGKRKLGSISKEGNPHLRAALIQSSWSVLRSKGNDPLTLWALAVAERRGSRIAVVAVARRLARLMWAIWKDGTFYDPEHLAKRIAAGLHDQAEDIETHARIVLNGQRKLDRQRRASARRAEQARELIMGATV